MNLNQLNEEHFNASNQSDRHMRGYVGVSQADKVHIILNAPFFVNPFNHKGPCSVHVSPPDGGWRREDLVNFAD